jgi:hypothetical protein
MSAIVRSLQKNATEVAQDLTQVGVEARRGGSIDHPVVPCQ